MCVCVYVCVCVCADDDGTMIVNTMYESSGPAGKNKFHVKLSLLGKKKELSFTV